MGGLPAEHVATVRARLGQISHAQEGRSKDVGCSVDTAEHPTHLLGEHSSIEEDAMPTFNDPVGDADEVREAVRALAHATRNMKDPTAIYNVIGSLSSALGSMAQVLQQLGATHDRLPTDHGPGPVGRTDRAAAYQVSWELHRAAEMVTQVAATVDRAHQLEAGITYDVHLPVGPLPTARRESGLSL